MTRGVFAALAALAACLPLFAADLQPPPVAARQAHKLEIHGDTLADDYLWQLGVEKP